MTNALNGPRIKLRKARAHADDLHKQIAAYLASEPFTVEREEEAGTGNLVFRVRVRAPVPEEFGAGIGDVIHNARAALDLVIWQAVLAAGGQPGKPTCFPIAKDEPSYQKTRGNALAGASADVFTLVDGLKPYSGGNDQLWRLHNLDILDKHRALVPVGAANRNVILTFKPPAMPGFAEGIEFPPIALRPADRLFPLRDGAEVYRVCEAARGESFGMDEPRCTFEVAFGDGQFVDGEEVFSVLDALVKEVERVIDFVETHIFGGGPAGPPAVQLPPRVTALNTNTSFNLDKLQVVITPDPAPGMTHPLFGVTGEGVKRLCLFTTEARAAPFLENLKGRGCTDAVMFHPPTPAAWLDLLGCMEKQGINYVSLDVLSDKPGQMTLIAVQEMMRTITKATASAST